MAELGGSRVALYDGSLGASLLGLLFLNDRSDFEVAEVGLQQAARLRGGNRGERRDVRLVRGGVVCCGATPEEEAHRGARGPADEASEHPGGSEERANLLGVRPGRRAQALGEQANVLGREGADFEAKAVVLLAKRLGITRRAFGTSLCFTVDRVGAAPVLNEGVNVRLALGGVAAEARQLVLPAGERLAALGQFIEAAALFLGLRLLVHEPLA